jgi:DNA-binding MarR family transcriptional regulator
MANKSLSTAARRTAGAGAGDRTHTAYAMHATHATQAAPHEDALAEIADRLHSAAIHLLRRVRRVDTGMGLTPARASALSVLVFGGPKTIGELAAAEQVSAPTMTRLIAGLERDVLLRRHPDPHDRRIVRVTATPRAANILRRGRQARIRELTNSLATLTPDELAVLGRASEILRTLNSR